MWLRTLEGCTWMGWMSATVSTSIPFFSSSSLISSVSARIDTTGEKWSFQRILKKIHQILPQDTCRSLNFQSQSVAETTCRYLKCAVTSPWTTTSGLGMVEKRRFRGSISPAARNPLKMRRRFKSQSPKICFSLSDWMILKDNWKITKSAYQHL